MTDMALMRSALDDAQRSYAQHKRSFQRMKKVHHDTEDEEFNEELNGHIDRILLVKKREHAAERLVHNNTELPFALVSRRKAMGAGAAGNIENESPNAATEEADDDSCVRAQVALDSLLMHLAKRSNCKNVAVRGRACQLVALVLDQVCKRGAKAVDKDVGSGVALSPSANTMTAIETLVLARLRDKAPTVRAHAVLCAGHLQSVGPIDAEAVEEELLRVMSSDTSKDVRRTAVETIALTPATLPAVLERSRDMHEAVRNAVLSVAESPRLAMDQLSIEQRTALLQHGLGDRSSAVRARTIGLLCDKWLPATGGDPVALLAKLDVVDGHETCVKVAKALLEQLVVSGGGSAVDVGTLLATPPPADQLTDEAALWFAEACKHLHAAGHAAADEYVPSLSELAAMVESAYGASGLGDRSFVAARLFEACTAIASDGDELGRRRVSSQALKMLGDADASEELAEVALAAARATYLSNNEFASFAATAINTAAAAVAAGDADPLSQVAGGDDDDEEVEETDGDVALTHALVIGRWLLRTCPRACIVPVDDQEGGEDDDGSEAEEEREVEGDAEPSGRKGAVVIDSICQRLAVPGLQRHWAHIRKLAIEVIGLACLVRPALSSNFAQVLTGAALATAEDPSVRRVAILAATDMVLVHPSTSAPADTDTLVEALAVLCEESGGTNGDCHDDDEETVNAQMDLRNAAIGCVCRLTCIGRHQSPKLLGRLLVLLFESADAGLVETGQILSAFFPAMCARKPVLVVDAAVKALRVMMAADKPVPASAKTSPFSMVQFIAHNMVDDAAVGALARRIALEAAAVDPEAPQCAKLVRALCSVPVTRIGSSNAAAVLGLVENELLTAVTNKTALRQLTKLKDALNEASEGKADAVAEELEGWKAEHESEMATLRGKNVTSGRGRATRGQAGSKARKEGSQGTSGRATSTIHKAPASKDVDSESDLDESEPLSSREVRVTRRQEAMSTRRGGRRGAGKVTYTESDNEDVAAIEERCKVEQAEERLERELDSSSDEEADEMPANEEKQLKQAEDELEEMLSSSDEE